MTAARKRVKLGPLACMVSESLTKRESYQEKAAPSKHSAHRDSYLDHRPTCLVDWFRKKTIDR